MVTQEAEVTNAGLGSNLTLEGSVEADASIMLGDKTFAAIGAAPGLHRALLACLYRSVSHLAPLPELSCSVATLESLHDAA